MADSLEKRTILDEKSTNRRFRPIRNDAAWKTFVASEDTSSKIISKERKRMKTIMERAKQIAEARYSRQTEQTSTSNFRFEELQKKIDALKCKVTLLEYEEVGRNKDRYPQGFVSEVEVARRNVASKEKRPELRSEELLSNICSMQSSPTKARRESLPDAASPIPSSRIRNRNNKSLGNSNCSLEQQISVATEGLQSRIKGLDIPSGLVSFTGTQFPGSASPGSRGSIDERRQAGESRTIGAYSPRTSQISSDESSDEQPPEPVPKKRRRIESPGSSESVESEKSSNTRRTSSGSERAESVLTRLSHSPLRDPRGGSTSKSVSKPNQKVGDEKQPTQDSRVPPLSPPGRTPELSSSGVQDTGRSPRAAESSIRSSFQHPPLSHTSSAPPHMSPSHHRNSISVQPGIRNDQRDSPSASAKTSTSIPRPPPSQPQGHKETPQKVTPNTSGHVPLNRPYPSQHNPKQPSQIPEGPVRKKARTVSADSGPLSRAPEPRRTQLIAPPIKSHKTSKVPGKPRKPKEKKVL